MLTPFHKPVKAILTGATGMVGEGVLHECMRHPDVEEVLIVGRRASGVSHPKVKELVVPDMHDLSGVQDQLTGYNTCFFCLGTTSLGKNQQEYTTITYTLTLGFADTLSRLNPGMIFCYISGASTNINGRQMWARVKGRTENDLMKLPFERVYTFRPGYMHATPGLKNTLPAYKYVSWMYPILKFFAPNSVSTLAQMGRAMIHSASKGYPLQILERKDINLLADI
jgi:uncharacterized protein YbjT (DUF2867 family)